MHKLQTACLPGRQANYKLQTLLFFLCFITLCNNSAYARDIRFEAAVNKNEVSIGTTAQLNLSFYGAQDISAPDLPDINGFDWQYIGPSTRMSIVNGKVSSSITHMYILMPLKEGEFMIPPFSVYYRGKTYDSEAIPIKVIEGARPAPGPIAPPAQGEEEERREPLYDSETDGIEKRIFLNMETGKQTAYVNETIPLTIKLYIDRLSVRDIQFPEFAHESFLADEFEEPKQYDEVLGGERYHVIEFNTNISGLRSGEQKLGPAELNCSVLIRKRRGGRWPFDDDFLAPDPFSRFFSDYDKRPMHLKSFTKTITILPLPGENIPPGFNGAVGDFRFDVTANPKDVKVGDPITLKMSVTGNGNFNTVKLPEFVTNDEFKVYDPNIKQDKTGKTFEQVIIPKTDRIDKIPEIRFSYFDTKAGSYKTIEKGLIPVKVAPLPRGEELKIFDTAEGVARAAQKKESLGKDIIYIKQEPGKLKKRGKFLCENRPFVIFQAIPILAVILALIIHKRRNRIESDVSYARRLRAPRRARKNLIRVKKLLDSKETGRFFDASFKTLQEYLGDKFHLPTAGITSSVVDTLKSRNVNKEILDKIAECFQTCDRARYAPSEITKEDMHGTLKLLEQIINGLGR